MQLLEADLCVKVKRNQSGHPQQVNRLPNCAAHSLWNAIQQCDTQTTWMDLQGTALNGEVNLNGL